MYQSPSQPDPSPLRGDQRLFLRLFSQHQRRLYAYIFTLIPNRADADDLLQEVSITLWERFDTSEPGKDYMSCAMRVAFLKV